MPRMFDLAEHYDNHQLEISESFEKRGLVHVATSPAELRDALEIARETDPPGATTDPQALMEWLKTTLTGLAAQLPPRRAGTSAGAVHRDPVRLPAPD